VLPAKAAEKCTKENMKNPSPPQQWWIPAVMIILLLFGATYSRNSMWQRDETAFWEIAVSKSPRKFRPHYNLGVQYDKKGLLQQAESEFRTAIQLNPADARPHNNLGWVYVKQNRLVEAVLEFQTATRLNQSHYRAWKNLQAAYERLGRYPDSEKAGRSAESVYHYDKGRMLAQQGRYDDAMIELNTAVMLNPDYRDALREIEILSSRKTMTTSPLP
jgi:protein O-mannosyl-transferase